jgi:putative membrane protein
MYEVEAGKIANQKGQSDAVKQFGQQMVDAHTKTTEELTGIVHQKNIKADLPTKLDSKHQELIDDLSRASAENFDKTYAKQQVDGHQAAVDLFKEYAERGDDPDLKQFAERTLPTIQHHLDEAKSYQPDRRQLSVSGAATYLDAFARSGLGFALTKFCSATQRTACWPVHSQHYLWRP